MELKVLSSIFPGSRDFKCRDENGKEYYMDLYVDGGINESDWPAEKLIGKTVEPESIKAYDPNFEGELNFFEKDRKSTNFLVHFNEMTKKSLSK